MSNIFSLFGSKSPITPPPEGKIPYKAFTCYDPDSSKYRSELGIVIHYEHGEDEVMYYSYLMRAICPNPGLLAMMCTDCVYTMTGKNLTALLPLLRDHHVRSIEAFDPNRHLPLAPNDAEMVIDSIYVQNNADWWDAIEQRRAAREQETSNTPETS